MNELSWLLYMANVLPNLGTTLGLLSAPLFLGAAFSIGFCIFGQDDATREFRSGEGHVEIASAEENTKKLRSLFAKPAWIFSLLFLAFVTGAILSPTRETMYAIAASEMGEKVATSPTGQKALRAIDAWLDRQIEGEPPAAE